MSLTESEEKTLKQIEIETAAFNRIIISVLSVLNEEQRAAVHKKLEQGSLRLISEMKDDNHSLYNREQKIRQHALELLDRAKQTF